MNTKIKEIFASIQGEGPVVGYKQLFVRFCDCNLHCSYCDTDFEKENSKEYSPKELFEKITKEYDLKSFHSISLTGGEPLLSVEFLKEFLPMLKGKIKIYLETNATLLSNLEEIKDYVDIIAGDIKLESSTGLDTMKLHERFFEKCSGVETFAKVVFDDKITDEEISKVIAIGKNNNLELVLQPKMIGDKMSVNSDFCNEILDRITLIYPKDRKSVV